MSATTLTTEQATIAHAAARYAETKAFDVEIERLARDLQIGEDEAARLLGNWVENDGPYVGRHRRGATAWG
ncbi:DNA binding protein [Gordonia phage BiggityBass]|nr:DNA binding protein [Gordonia phage BiggityBass]